MEGLKDIIKKEKDNIAQKAKYVTKEYQDYGYRLAVKLDDKKRVAMYIKLAKERPRAELEKAYSFAIDYPNAKNKSKLFMWKLKEIRKEYKENDKKSDF